MFLGHLLCASRGLKIAGKKALLYNEIAKISLLSPREGGEKGIKFSIA